MMKFKNWKDMYNLISKGIDLYNPETETFVSVYNDAGALCTYDISKEEAKTLVKESEGTNESWLAFLGIGGNILDDTYYDGARYLKDDPKYELYIAPSYDFCKNNYGLDGWMTTDKYRFEVDMADKLAARFNEVIESQTDELDFFMELLEVGYTLDDIKKYCPERYEFSKLFMEEHGLI